MSAVMKLDTAKLKRWREERCWSQDHLAATSGLSLRTIQRLERGEGVSQETARALAAAYAVSVETLMVEPETPALETAEKRRTPMLTEERLAFVVHIIAYLFSMIMLLGFGAMAGEGAGWILPSALGWGACVFAHGVVVLASGLSDEDAKDGA